MKKVCSKCRQKKDTKEFGRSSESKDGLKYYCRVCRGIEAKIYKQNHRIRCYTPATGTVKRCSICKQTKPVEDFGKNCCRKDGRESRCRICLRKYGKERRQVYLVRYSSVLQMNIPLKKTCSRCKKEKTFEEFYIIKGLARGLKTECKQCWKEIRMDLWRNDANYKRKSNERRKKYDQTHKKEKSEYNKQYSKNNKGKRNQRLNQRRKTDLEFKILCLLKSRVLSAIKKQCTKKAYKTKELIGCTVPDLIKHLESQFDDKMTWKNHGRYGWHIDHIIPCAYFDLTKPEEQKKCFNYKNLQPLWGPDNFKKSSWYQGKLYRKKHLTSSEIEV
jgi:hypothetical protein